jgi:YHS domain-containing protein
MKLLPCIAILIYGMTLSLEAQTTAIHSKNLNLDNGLALEGYDPVSYIVQKKAVEGKSNLSYVHGGVTYRFSTQENRDAFKKNPTQYEPMYGGWCAFAMGSNGEKVEVDPETFKVVNGKLYLFYNKYFNNTLIKWDKDEPSLMKKADVNWKKFSN